MRIQNELQPKLYTRQELTEELSNVLVELAAAESSFSGFQPSAVEKQDLKKFYASNQTINSHIKSADISEFNKAVGFVFSDMDKDGRWTDSKAELKASETLIFLLSPFEKLGVKKPPDWKEQLGKDRYAQLLRTLLKMGSRFLSKGKVIP